ncbi:hypothetical protein P879_09599 [Paragonimus westermani]|uniref:Lebercilin domain-containing protein n=1 Tax=Paragonimus westermani TaxID=34504 RepID=A0A8T0DBG0_9TREM|nr:hypothetical protein P879_09599 [Paragonimus westermani]
MTICVDHNNNMMTNGDVSKVTTPRTEDDVVESEQYDSEFEQLNDTCGHRSDLSSVCTHPKQSNDHSSQIIGVDHCVNTSDRKVGNAAHRKQKSQRMSYKPMIKKTGLHTGVPAALMQQSVVDRWETAQLALGEAHSQNVHLQRQLQECRAELRTVQRQCKLQSARLNKAIGQEADLPRIVDRLTADVRSLQIRLREKIAQCETSQRKVNELQHRIFVLEKECEEKQNVILPDDIALRKQAIKMEEVLAELDREKKKVAVGCFSRA